MLFRRVSLSSFSFVFSDVEGGCRIGTGPNSINGNGIDGTDRNFSTISVPSKDNTGKKVIELGYRSLAKCPNLESVFIPSSIVSIQNGALFDNHKLLSVNFEQNSELTFIDSYGFQNDYLLRTITIPPKVTALGDGMFLRCESLTTVIFCGSYTFGTINSSLFWYGALPTVQVYVSSSYQDGFFVGKKATSEGTHCLLKTKELFSNIRNDLISHFIVICIFFFATPFWLIFP